MNSLKKCKGVPLLNFEGGSRGPGSWGPGPTFTPCRLLGLLFVTYLKL